MPRTHIESSLQQANHALTPSIQPRTPVPCQALMFSTSPPKIQARRPVTRELMLSAKSSSLLWAKWSAALEGDKREDMLSGVSSPKSFI